MRKLSLLVLLISCSPFGAFLRAKNALGHLPHDLSSPFRRNDVDVNQVVVSLGLKTVVLFQERIQNAGMNFEKCRASSAKRLSTAPSPMPTAGSPASSRVPKTLARLRWMHVPKCGTSFATTLFAYVCGNASHPPVSNASVVTLAKFLHNPRSIMSIYALFSDCHICFK
jgi:hypothetical protein